MTNESRSRLYWPQLDGLRFFAAFFVFLHHSDFVPAPERLKDWGWIGVDLFLVLSAFLLTRLLRAEIESGSGANLGHYFLRRICRIWPLHLAFVSAMLLLKYWTEPHKMGAATFEWFSHVAFFNNLLAAVENFTRALPHARHLWTISLEEQYYLLVPFLVPLLVGLRSRVAVARVLGLGLLALWIGRLVCVVLEMRHPFIWTSPLRMDAMLLGTALGLGLLDREWSPTRAGTCFAAGWVLLAATTLLPDVRIVGWSQVPIYTLVDVGCCLLVIGSLHNPAIAKFLSLRMLRYLGKVSFGIYVFHIAVLHYAQAYFVENQIWRPWLLFFVSLGATCLLASLSYELFEKHFLKLKRRFTTIASRPV